MKQENRRKDKKFDSNFHDSFLIKAIEKGEFFLSQKFPYALSKGHWSLRIFFELCKGVAPSFQCISARSSCKRRKPLTLQS